MAAAPTPATPATQALRALADRPGATATELAEAAGIGRSIATKLLATLAGQGRVLRQPGGHKDGRRAADRWTLSTTTTAGDARTPTAAGPASPAARPPSTEQASTGSGRLRPGALRDLVLACLAERRARRRCHPPRSPSSWTARPVRSPTPSGRWPTRAPWSRPWPSLADTPSPLPTATRPPRPTRPPIQSAAGGAATPPAGAHQEAEVPMPYEPIRQAKLPGDTPRSCWRWSPMSCVDR
jgi:MarR family